MRRHVIGLALACPLVLVIGWSTLRPSAVGAADEPPALSGGKEAVRTDGVTAWTTAVEPKPLSDHVKKGLAWIAEHQNRDGGWGQGEEAPQMRGSSRDELRNRPNVADTCIAALALIRSGSTPTSGPYRDAVAKAVRFVEQSVESSDSQSIAVTTVQGTRVQAKLGPNIDTFLASLLLAEVKGRMGGSAEDHRAVAALDKILDKIKRHQKADGSFDGQGWAPILAEALCGKGINRARQAGAAVPAMVLANAENGAKLAANAMRAAAPAAEVISADSDGGPIGGSAPLARSKTVVAGRAAGYGMSSSMGGAGMRSAGVELYARAANIGVLQDSVNTLKAEASQLREEEKADNPERRDKARKRLAEIADTEAVHQRAQADVVGRLDDKGFVAGFGSNGGEEFLSYMNIAESLVVKGGDAWKTWDEKTTANLNRIQNDDGTWTGHHCITGRTFCTSAALLVLMADRTPIPAGAKDGAKADAR